MSKMFAAIKHLGWTTIRDFFQDHAMAHAAAITFYALLSLAPLLVMVLALAGLLWDRSVLRSELVGQFGGLMGEPVGQAIDSLIDRAGSRQWHNGVAAAFGVLLLCFGSLGVFGQVKAALNAIWEVETRPNAGIWRIIQNRLLSMAMVACVAFLLLISLSINATLSALAGWLEGQGELSAASLWVIEACASMAVITLLFAAMYKLLPDVRMQWQDVWIGAAGTAILFIVGKYAIGFYLGKSSTVSVYGAAGSVVMILMWVYYSSIIFLLGAEFTQAFAHWRGAEIVPSRIAQPLEPRVA